MKAVKNITQTKTQKEINISVFGEKYKFETLRFNLKESKNYFEVYGTRVTRNNKLSVICDIKSLRGNIDKTKFTFESLDKEMTLRHYIQNQNNVNFVNKLSLNYNNKKWFNMEENSIGAIAPIETTTKDSTNDKNEHLSINKLEQTCILNNKITENFSEIPIYWYDRNVHQKYRTTIVELEIITDILSKKFPSFKTQIHNLIVNELNISEITNSNLEERIEKSNEELMKKMKNYV